MLRSLKQWQSWIRHIIHHLEERDVALNGSSWQSTMERPDRAIDNCQGYCQVDQHSFQKHLSPRKHLTDGGECIALPASVKLGILRAHLSQKGVEPSYDQMPSWGFCTKVKALPPVVTFPQAFDLTTMWYWVDWLNAWWFESESKVWINVINVLFCRQWTMCLLCFGMRFSSQLN